VHDSEFVCYGVRSTELSFKFQLSTQPRKPEAEGVKHKKKIKNKVKRKRTIKQRLR